MAELLGLLFRYWRLIGGVIGIGVIVMFGLYLVDSGQSRPEGALVQTGGPGPDPADVARAERERRQHEARMAALQAESDRQLVEDMRGWSNNQLARFWDSVARLTPQAQLERYEIIPEADRAALIGPDHAILIASAREMATTNHLNERADLAESEAHSSIRDVRSAARSAETRRLCEVNRLYEGEGYCWSCTSLAMMTREREMLWRAGGGTGTPPNFGNPFGTNDFYEVCERQNIPERYCDNCRDFLIDDGWQESMERYYPEYF